MSIFNQNTEVLTGSVGRFLDSFSEYRVATARLRGYEDDLQDPKKFHGQTKSAAVTAHQAYVAKADQLNATLEKMAEALKITNANVHAQDEHNMAQFQSLTKMDWARF
ncbi:MAG: hypothetical protein HOQ24_17620 [Mycobacteriaceae bacterium]|nr:hypothetical protein [Mycobacteriaceae bacterium]